MSQAKSFIGEYSIGLSFVSIIKKLLHKKYEFVIPIVPWMTREGSNISKHLHRNDKFQVFGIYPRRPKLNMESEDIEFKINRQIIEGACEGLKLGIPIIAGGSVVKSFWELNKDTNYLWVRLDSSLTEEFRIQINGNEINSIFPKAIIKNHEILNYIIEKAKSFTIDEALNAFKEINRVSMKLDSYPKFGLSYIYKPIYFLLK